MDGETFHIAPNVVVILGVRSLLSAVGLVTAFVGYWHMEHKWDNDGSAAVRQHHNTKEEYVEMREHERITKEVTNETKAPPPPVTVNQSFHPSGAREIVRVSTMDSKDENYHPVEAAAQEGIIDPEAAAAASVYGSPEVLQTKLQNAMPIPLVMLGGFFLWAISFLFDPSIGGFRVYANAYNVLSLFNVSFAGVLIAFYLRDATIERNVDQKKTLIRLLIVLLVNVCLFATLDPVVDAPWFFNVFGVLFMLLSYNFLRNSRKMGLTWDLEGKPNDDVHVQNPGPLLLLLGVFFLWVGTNGMLIADLQQSYLPLFVNSRSLCVVIAGMFIILPAQLALDLAFDQGSEPIRDKPYPFSLDGGSFQELSRSIKFLEFGPLARMLETPLLWCLGWAFMAMCCFLPFGATGLTIQKFCAMTACLVIAPVYACLVLPALWRADSVSYQRWSYVYYALLILLATAVGIVGGIALLLSMTGVFFILVGKRRDLYERKRGQSWLESGTVNPNPEVYGIGQPLNVLGWIFLCLAISVPM